MTLLIYNQETKRTDITDKHQPTSTFLSKFNPKTNQLNFGNSSSFKRKKKLNIFQTKTFKRNNNKFKNLYFKPYSY